MRTRLCWGKALLALAILSLSACGSAGTGGPGGADAMTEHLVGQDAVLDVLQRQCEVNWEKEPSTELQNATKPTHYTRPFFTMCKDGKFYWNDWQVYEEPITPEEAAVSGNEIRCPSGQCKWGICREDAEFFESQIPPGTKMLDGVLELENTACAPCNPNNIAYSFNGAEYDKAGSEYECEGTFECCSNPAAWGGPCRAESWYWSIILRTADRTGGLTVGVGESGFAQSLHSECVDSAEVSCYPGDNARCVKDTATLMASQWSQDNLGAVFSSTELALIVEARLTMGTSTRMKALMASPQEACVPSERVSQHPFSYWTCSGMASIKLEDGRWFKYVWLHPYSRESCDRPCWLSALTVQYEYAGVPIKYAFWEIPGEPKW